MNMTFSPAHTGSGLPGLFPPCPPQDKLCHLWGSVLVLLPTGSPFSCLGPLAPDKSPSPAKFPDAHKGPHVPFCTSLVSPVVEHMKITGWPPSGMPGCPSSVLRVPRHGTQFTDPSQPPQTRSSGQIPRCPKHGCPPPKSLGCFQASSLLSLLCFPFPCDLFLFLNYVPMGAGACGGQKRVCAYPGAGVTRGREPPNVGAGNGT